MVDPQDRRWEVKVGDDGYYFVVTGHRLSYFKTEKAAQDECARLNARVRFPEPERK